MIIPTATAESPVWLRVGTLLDGGTTVPVRDAHVVYDGAFIRFVGREGRTPPRELLRPGQDCPDADLPGCTLLPGLSEAHAHLFLEGGELDPETRAAWLKRPAADLLAAASDRLPRLVRLGVTAVRDAGDRHGVGLALSRRYTGRSADGTSGPASARTLMPYVESPGAAIHHRGRYGSFMGEAIEDFATPRACVEARVRAGADRIKLIPTGIIDFRQGRVTSEPQMTVAEIAECSAAAQSLGRQTFAHASGDAGIDRVIDGGVDSIEHGFFVRDDQLARMRDRRTAWVPTFAPVQAQVDHADMMGWDAATTANLRSILERHAVSLVKAHALGVLIVAGSDAGSYGVAHGTGLLREMALMEAAGLPSIVVVNCATGAGSGRFGYKENFGRIAPGCLSRLILTRHSPLDTVANLMKPRLVVFDGAVYEAGGGADEKGL